MTPAARAQAAISILDQILAGHPAEAALLRWSRSSRFAGSGDRAAVRDLVFDSLRRRRSRAVLGGSLTGRGLILGMCREEGTDPDLVFSGEGHAPGRLMPDERTGGAQPSAEDLMDLPDWVLPHWSRALDRSAPAIAAAMRERAPVWLRANALLAKPEQAVETLAEDGILTERSEEIGHALRITEGARRLAGSRAYREGLVELQDLSPQLACAALPRVNSVLDYCAGGGGKALALAAQGAREITAHDSDPARMSDLPARAARAGARIRIAKPGQIKGRFDLVLTDVPCSGSGTWRRTPDAKWRLQPADLERLVDVQSRILDEAARFLAPQGYLAYMTCSLFEQENGTQIEDFLRRSGFERIKQRVFTPLDASDGFFLALLRAR